MWAAAVLAMLAGCGADDDAPTPFRDAGRGIFFPDAGPRPLPDAGPLLEPDAGAGCFVGEACEGDDCPPGHTCQTEMDYGPVPAPAGCETPAHGYFVGGYCTPAPLAMPTTGCDPNDERACGDPACAKCVDLGGVVMCVRSCTPSATGNDCPQPTQTCLFGDEYCFDGCQGDNECRVYREDTDMDGDIEAPGPMEMAVDRLVCDVDSRATCNPVTRRCDQPSGGGVGGDPCIKASQCETNGACIAGWPDGGYCTRFGCDVPGITCEGDGKCQSRRVGVAICGQPCIVAGEPSECRPGYACTWDGMTPAGVPNGICLPGLFNDRTEPNIGAPCDANAEVPDCWSPFGQGACLGGDGTAWGPDNYCSVLDCAAPGMPLDICGPAGRCLVFFTTDGDRQDLGACFETCTTADSCNTGHACLPATTIVDGATGNICFPLCTADDQCRATERCVVSSDGAGRCT